MGFLKFFTKSAPTLLKLPAGSFTMDSTGRVLVNTLPSSFPANIVMDIGRTVIDAFRDAHEAHLPLNELVIHYPSLKVTAKELRGGALIFLTPMLSTISPKVTS